MDPYLDLGANIYDHVKFFWIAFSFLVPKIRLLNAEIQLLSQKWPGWYYDTQGRQSLAGSW